MRPCVPDLNEGWLTVLPGMGWDNLVNEERGPTLDRERYEKCSRFADGRLIIPDDIIVGKCPGFKHVYMFTYMKLRASYWEYTYNCLVVVRERKL